MSECLTAKLKTIYVFTAKLLTLGCNLVLNCLGLGYEEGGGGARGHTDMKQMKRQKC